MAVLVGVAFGVAGNLFAAIGDHFQESLKRGKRIAGNRADYIVAEAESSAEVVIDNLHDGGAAEFVAELHVMLPRLPRIVVDEVPVGVDAVARDRTCGADLGEATNTSRREPSIVRSDSSVETDGVGIEILILRKEPFSEPVPAQAGLIDLAAIHHFHIGECDQLHAGWRYGVETRQQAAGELSKRETLTAVAEVIAAAQNVVGIEILIDLSDEAVNAIEKLGGSGEVGRVASVLRITLGSGNIGSRPGMARKELGGDGAHHLTLRRDLRFGV